MLDELKVNIMTNVGFLMNVYLVGVMSLILTDLSLNGMMNNKYGVY